MHDPVEVAMAIFDAASGADKPVLCVLMARDDVTAAVKESGGDALPVYPFPEAAVKALGAMVRYRELLQRDPGTAPSFDVDRDAAEAVFRAVVADGRRDLTLDESRRVVEAYGIRFARSVLVRERTQLAAAADFVGMPTVAKLTSHEILHKTEVGGVATDLRTLEELERAYDAILERARDAGAAVEGVLVQEMRKGAQEMIVGVTIDPSFGPLLMAGMGGTHVEVLRDVTFRIHPITDRDADEMVDGLRGAPLLRGVRGQPPVAEAAYKDALLRISQLVGDFHCIAELDVNPFMVGATDDESMAVDARIRIDPGRV
jgi:acetyltransferase